MPRNFSEEERKRRSELAKSLHEKGVFGGAQPGAGRPPTKRRAMQAVAEEAQRSSGEIVAAFRAGVALTDENGRPNPVTVRVNSAREWLQVERHETELQIKETAQLDDMSLKELQDVVLAKLGRLEASGHNLFDLDVVAEELLPAELEDGEDE